jgi:hypothetical protein
MASEWIGIAGTLSGVLLGAGAAYLTQRAQWRRQDQIRRESEQLAAYEAFLAALRVCTRQIEQWSQYRGDSQQVRAFFSQFEQSDELKELVSTLPRLQMFGSREAYRLGKEIDTLLLWRDGQDPRFLLQGLDRLEAALQLEIRQVTRRRKGK